MTTLIFHDDLIIIPSTSFDTNLLELLNIDEEAVTKDSTLEITVINLFKNKYLNGDYDNE